MDLIFCGTPEFAVPTLDRLVEAGHNVRLVVTQPDRPRGRGLDVGASPVKRRAEQLHLPVVQPDKIKNNAAFRERLESLRPRAIIVVGYGRIIPKWMIDLPPHGNLNLHASLLPKYRGAAPIQWAIACGETVTGVTTIRINEGLDTGDILLQRALPIAHHDTAETLAPKLAALGADLTVDTLRGLEASTLEPRPQAHEHATLAPILKKEDGLIDFAKAALEIHNHLRGFQPWPGVYSTFRGKNLAIHRAQVAESASIAEPGALLAEGERLRVGCGEGTALELLEVQPEGKRRMAARDFLNGYRPRPGERLGA